MKSDVFRFKRFSVRHGRSSMKVGVDGVLIALWADVSGCRRILDAGCGCGVISLICAQRSPSASVTAIDIDGDSAEEAACNFAASPWAERLDAACADFCDFGCDGEPFDLIISNPPFFQSGLTDISTSRERARHVGCFGPLSLLERSAELLSDNGSVALVAPAASESEIMRAASACGMGLQRLARVRGLPEAPVKRVLMQFGRRSADEVQAEELVLESEPLVPTDAYRMLGRDFYLKF